MHVQQQQQTTPARSHGAAGAAAAAAGAGGAARVAGGAAARAAAGGSGAGIATSNPAGSHRQTAAGAQVMHGKHSQCAQQHTQQNQRQPDPPPQEKDGVIGTRAVGIADVLLDMQV